MMVRSLCVALLLVCCLAFFAEAGRQRKSHPLHNIAPTRTEFHHFRFAAAHNPKLPYKADSGGCTPLTNYEKHPKDGSSKWQEWEKRLPKLAAKVKSMSHGERAATVLEALGPDNIWHQIVDGWSQLGGSDSFGPEYVTDMKRGFKECAKLLKSGFDSKTFNADFYINVHHTAFEKTAVLLHKRNGLRGSNSWIYLPMPDKPMAVFKDIHLNGKKTYSTALRKLDKNGDYDDYWKWNKGYQMRWVYPNIPKEATKGNITELFTHFWREIAKITTKDENEARSKKLDAVVWIYHSLENLHPFVDGNGRTDILVLDTLLSFVGLHPVNFYNSMESALSSVDEMREKVLEGYFMWEQTMLNIENKKKPYTGWKLDMIKAKNKECDLAVKKLTGKAPADGEFIPDTMGGCMCKNVADCDKNKLFKESKWCYTNAECTWPWDYCADGRQKQPQHPKEPHQKAYHLPH